MFEDAYGKAAKEHAGFRVVEWHKRGRANISDYPR
jgi:hypothetical protein